MIELLIPCSLADAEALSDQSLELGALSATLEDADRDTPDEQALFGEAGTEPEVLAWSRNSLKVLLSEDTDAEAFLEQLLQNFPEVKRSEVQIQTVQEQDWVRLTQSQFDPIQLGRRIWIVPSWHQSNPDVLAAEQSPEAILIELDPGLAFGTGSHPTTRLCAEWLEDSMPAGCTVLDYGCGSGILAIIAKKLQAAQVEGVDIDPQAVDAARFNAAKNDCELSFCLPDELAAGAYDIVVANILSSPLKVLAPMLSGRVKPSGWLVLSGILERQAQELIEAYAPWMSMQIWKQQEGWVCLAGQKAPQESP